MKKGGGTYVLTNAPFRARFDIKSLACAKKQGISGTARRNESRGWRTWGQEPRGLPESALDNFGLGSDSERRGALGDLELGSDLVRLVALTVALAIGGDVMKIEGAGGPGERGQGGPELDKGWGTRSQLPNVLLNPASAPSPVSAL